MSSFITMLRIEQVIDPANIQEKYKEYFYKQLKYCLDSGILPYLPGLKDLYLDYSLYLINITIYELGKTLSYYYLPDSVYNQDRFVSNPLITAKLSYNLDKQTITTLEYIAEMNTR